MTPENQAKKIISKVNLGELKKSTENLIISTSARPTKITSLSLYSTAALTLCSLSDAKIDWSVMTDALREVAPEWAIE